MHSDFHMPSRCRSDDEFDEYGYQVAFVHGQQGAGRKRRVLVAWKDFSFRDDTWELAEDVYPKAKLLKYENAIASVHVLGEPLEDVREALARRLCSKLIGERRPAWELPLEIPRINNRAIAEPLLRFLARKRGGGAYKVQELQGGGLKLQMEQLPDIGGAIALQAVRPEACLGNVRIKCGGASYEDMAVLSGLTLVFQGRMLKAHVTVVIFNGKTGMPDFPKAGDSVKYSLKERNIIVRHAKKVLLQEWAPHPIKNYLWRVGWHALPKGVWRVHDKVATNCGMLPLTVAQWPKTAADIEKAWPSEYDPRSYVEGKAAQR